MSEKTGITIGIDIGGTKLVAALVKDGAITGEVLSYKTPDNVEGIKQTLLEAVGAFCQTSTPCAVGIATAGTVNTENTRVTGSTGNLPPGYSDIDFSSLIKDHFGIDVFVENDANAAAYAEFKSGSAKGHNNTIVLTLGTGIGGGVIVDGKLVRGKSGVGAECGHIPLSIEKRRPCTCGAWDCWEAYASGTGYAKNAQEMAAAIPEAERTGILKDKEPADITTYDVIQGIKENDKFALSVHERWEHLLMLGITALVNIFDPNSVILSGGMAKFVNYKKLQKMVDDRVVISKFQLLPAVSDNCSGIIGAGILAYEKFCR